MRFKIDWASLTVGSKFTFFALFYFVFEGNFPSTIPQGAYIWRGGSTDGFFALPVWGAYVWKVLYMKGFISEFYGMYFQLQLKKDPKQRCPFDKTDGITPIPIQRGLNS